MGNDNLTSLIGDPRELAVERALAEVRSGRPVLLSADGKHYLAAAAEAVEDDTLQAFAAFGARSFKLILSQPRLRMLGCDIDEPGVIAAEGMTAEYIHELIAQTGAQLNGHIPKIASKAEIASLELVKLAYLLPAALLAELPDDQPGFAASLVQIDADFLSHYREHVIDAPRIVSRAPVPLDDIGDTEFVVFRGGEGMRDHVAVIIGKPKTTEPVYTRLHSACLTGDLFASLKCDCGDQLRGSVKFMAENGGGVLLYLDQEGRGNGIANKIRAYRLQHAGYSTYDADEILGFDLDQRRFNFAAAMLRELGFSSVKLLTNNPCKVAALKEAGLDVVSSHRAKARFTLHNVAYLAAKRDRAGHLIEDDQLTAERHT